MKARIKEFSVEIIRERDGSYGIACPALGVFTVGATLQEARKNFLEALDLHLSVIRQYAAKAITN